MACEEYLKALDVIQKSGSDPEMQGSSTSPPSSSKALSTILTQFIINRVRRGGVRGVVSLGVAKCE